MKPIQSLTFVLILSTAVTLITVFVKGCIKLGRFFGTRSATKSVHAQNNRMFVIVIIVLLIILFVPIKIIIG